MFPQLQTFLSSLITESPTPWSLQATQGFPFLAYTIQLEIYQDLEDWYNGVPLNEQIKDAKTKRVIDKFPIKINPLKGTAAKHTAVLFGTSIESIRFGTIPVRFMTDSKKAQKKISDTIQEALLKVFEENNAGSLFVTNGIVSQYMGGCVFWASWNPDGGEDGKGKIEITTPSPKEVILIPKGSDYWAFKEAWMIRKIDLIEAMAYGYNQVGNPAAAAGYMNANGPAEGFWYYIEHWTEKEYSVQINEQYLIPKTNNPFGIVPVQYIPHIRDRNRFRGVPIITDAVKGIIKEINLRYADMGDAVSDDSHTIVTMANVRGSPKVVKIGNDSRPIIDLGSITGLGGAEATPVMNAVNTKSSSDPMLKFGQDLYAQYRIEVDHPAVADGVDQGSQRSSLTLTTRMFPLVTHAEMERIFWTVGLLKFAKILLKIMQVKKLYGITEEHLKMRLILEWTTMLPRDREALVNEVAVRAATKTGSRRHLIDILEDVKDSDEEIETIRSEMDLDAKSAAPTQNQPPSKPGTKKTSTAAVPMTEN